MDQLEGWLPFKDLHSLKAIATNMQSEMPIKASTSTQESIDVDQFALLVKQLDYDVKVFETWQRKCSNVAAARFHAKQAWKLSQLQKCQEGARKWFGQAVKFSQWGRKAEAAIASTMAFRKQAQLSLGADPDDTPIIAIANWTSLSEIPAHLYNHMNAFINWLLADDVNNLGLVLNPVHTYNRGKLHVDEQRVTTSLVNSPANIDCSFSLLFKDQVDNRDMRPLVYGGRMVLPNHIEPTKTIWWNSNLHRMRRTPEVRFSLPSISLLLWTTRKQVAQYIDIVIYFDTVTGAVI